MLPADVALVTCLDLADRSPAHFVTSMKDYKAREAVLSDCVSDYDDYHDDGQYNDYPGYYDCDDPDDNDDCKDCHLSMNHFDEPDDFELYHDLHGNDGCGEYCVSHGDVTANPCHP